jgi:serine/threonine-protein phosphatase 6 regulatory ankyrin repeat subunit B
MTAPNNTKHLFNVIEKVKEKTFLSYSTLIGINVNRRDNEGRNALYWAIKYHGTHNAKFLIEFEISLMVTPTLHGLFQAIDEDHYELVILLIQNGISPNITDNQGRSALMRAIEKEQFRTVCFLIRNGADIFQMDDQYDMALDHALKSNSKEISGFVKHILTIIEDEEKQEFITPCSGCTG